MCLETLTRIYACSHRKVLEIARLHRLGFCPSGRDAQVRRVSKACPDCLSLEDSPAPTTADGATRQLSSVESAGLHDIIADEEDIGFPANTDDDRGAFDGGTAGRKRNRNAWIYGNELHIEGAVKPAHHYARGDSSLSGSKSKPPTTKHQAGKRALKTEPWSLWRR